MDWNMLIEKNRDALKRIVAMLVAMAGLAGHSGPRAGPAQGQKPPPGRARGARRPPLVRHRGDGKARHVVRPP
jgi:hypothetical protein